MKKGFTIIEMLVVIVIMVLLVAIFVPTYNKVKNRDKNIEANAAPIGVIFNNDAMFNKENRFKTQTASNPPPAEGFHFCPRCGFDLYLNAKN